jgi:hypothetical protein
MRAHQLIPLVGWCVLGQAKHQPQKNENARIATEYDGFPVISGFIQYSSY